MARPRLRASGQRKTRAFVDPATFRLERLKAGLTKAAVATLLRVSERSVRNWEAGRSQVPYCALRLMCIEAGYHLPGEYWRGFLLRGDTIWSPEGKAFSSHDLAWWQLTCELARERRAQAFEPAAAASQSVPEAQVVLPRAADRRVASADLAPSERPSLQNRTLAANQDCFDDATPSPALDLALPLHAAVPLTAVRAETRSSAASPPQK